MPEPADDQPADGDAPPDRPRLWHSLLSVSADAATVLVKGVRTLVETGSRRWVHAAHGRVHVEVRGLRQPEMAAVGERLRERLSALPGISRVEINAALGVAVMAAHPDEIQVSDIVEVVEDIERLHGLENQPRPSSVRPLPGDHRSALGEAVALAANVTGVGLATAARALPVQLPAQLGHVVLSWADATPPVRDTLESLVGVRLTDRLLTHGGVAAHILAEQPLGLVIHVCHRFARFREERSRYAAWHAWDLSLAGHPGSHDHAAHARPKRASPLAPSTTGQTASRVGLFALPTSVAGLALTRSPDRALALLAAGTPKAARHGVESFAATVGRRFAERGMVVLDPAALRRLHRIDTVVIDADLLRAKHGPGAAGNGDGADLDPLADELIHAAQVVGKVLIGGVREPWLARFASAALVAGGPRLAESVRVAQAEGHGVAVVSSRRSGALAAADVAVGVTGRATTQPWTADVICGPTLADACVLLKAVDEARMASTRATQLTVAGATIGTIAAMAGAARGATGRAALPVNIAALLAFAIGTWLGTRAGGRRRPVAVDRTPWHTLAAESAVDRLKSTVDGLASETADRRNGVSAATDGQPSTDGLLTATVRELNTPFTPTLAIGAGLSAALGSMLDAGLIVAALGINALLGGIERVRGNRALHDLVDAAAVRVRVRRDGKVVEVNAEQLVPGDVVHLMAGDSVPADCRVLTAHGLEIDESSLTGESLTVSKTAEPADAESVADRRCMLYRGTTVAAGRGRGLVVAIGAATELGRTSQLGADEDKGGGARSRLASLATLTVPISVAAGALLLAVDLLRGRRFGAAIGHSIGLAVAAIPEGLPFVATSAELAAARRLSRRGVFVRNPSTVEALGRVNVLCFDKTGTLTEGRVALDRVSDGHTSARVDQLNKPLRQVLAAALRASPDGRKNRPIAHPTDRSIIEGARVAGVTVERGAPDWHKVAELPFEPSRTYHAVLGRCADGQRVSVKGAPETVLDRCVTWRRPGGDVAFDAAARAQIEQHIDRLARRGDRILAVAERQASDRGGLRPSRIDGLCLLGLLALADPVRPAAAHAVQRLARAGIGFVMLTGDHPSTAEATAAELNAVNGRRVMTGPEVEALDDRQLATRLAKVAVFARVTPEQKARIVRVLRESGRVVAVTGDGANDAPAIRLADVGIALGTNATPAARDAADVIVTDNRIETIAEAVVEGRAIWASVRDGVAILVGGNLGEIAFTVGTGILGGDALNVRQILLVNLLTDAVPAIAVAVRPPASGDPEQLLSEGPETSLGGALTRDMAVRAVATASAATAAWLGARLTGSRGQASTTGLVALVTAQLAQTLAVRGRTPLVVLSGIGAFGVLCLAVQVPGLNRICGCRALWPHQWGMALGAAAISTAAVVTAARLLSLVGRARRRVLPGSTQPTSGGHVCAAVR